MISLRKIKWTLRRVNVTVGKNALVLEVGSGGNPYPRANVLVDAYEETQERHWETVVCGACDAHYHYRNGVLVMNEEQK